MEEVYRVEKHIIKNKHLHYSMLDEFCFKSKNLYNFANYQIRQEFINNGKYIKRFDLDKLLKTEGLDVDYRAMPTAKGAQQLLSVLDQNWKSFFASIKDYGKHPDKYTGRPKLPKYLKKEGRNLIVLNNQECRVKEGIITFPRAYSGLTLKTQVSGGLQQVRVLPRNKYFVIEVVYKKEVPEIREDNGRYFSIDIGLDNLATITSNTGMQPVIVNGKGLKSMNKYYNKQMAYYKSVAKQMNGLDWTDRFNRLTIRRNNKINDYMHKASKGIVDFAVEKDISVIVIGNNKDWKRSCDLGTRVNQSFVQIPHQIFINQLMYKAENVGIRVILIEESYTSGTSFLDGEDPIKENYNKSRRKHRGLFISNQGIKINADVNASYQILKKVFSNVYTEEIEGVVLHPYVVSVA